MAQNEPQRKAPSLLFEYQCKSGKFIRLANRIEKIDSVARIESKLFLPELECSTSCHSANSIKSLKAYSNYTGP